MDTVYYYHHSNEIPKPLPGESQDGFYYPFNLVLAGWQEWKATGRYPNPIELAKRINSKFKGDIDHWQSLLDQGKPPPEE